MFNAEEDAGDVDAEDSVKVVSIIVDDSRLAGVSYASIVHHDVQLPKGFHGGYHRCLDLGFVCDITMDIEGVGRAEHGGTQCVTEVVLNVGDDYFSAMVNEEFCCAFTNPTCTAGY